MDKAQGGGQICEGVSGGREEPGTKVHFKVDPAYPPPQCWHGEWLAVLEAPGNREEKVERTREWERNRGWRREEYWRRKWGRDRGEGGQSIPFGQGLFQFWQWKSSNPRDPLSPGQTRTVDHPRSQRWKSRERVEREKHPPKWKQIGLPQVYFWKKSVLVLEERGFCHQHPETAGLLWRQWFLTWVSLPEKPGRYFPEEGAQTQGLRTTGLAHRILCVHHAHTVLAWNTCFPHPTVMRWWVLNLLLEHCIAM